MIACNHFLPLIGLFYCALVYTDITDTLSQSPLKSKKY